MEPSLSDRQARRVAAAAVLADFRAATAADPHNPRPDYWLWALRLAAELQSLLSVISDRIDGPVPGDVP